MTPQELYKNRKCKLFVIKQDEILKIFTKEAEVTNFPQNAVFADCGYRLDAQGFGLLVCHESFDPVPVDIGAPIIVAEWQDITNQTLRSKCLGVDRDLLAMDDKSLPGLKVYSALVDQDLGDGKFVNTWVKEARQK